MMKKKILSLVVGILTLGLFVGPVKADGFVASIVGDNIFNGTANLTVRVGNLSGFNTGLYGLDAVLNYDKSKIELVSATGLNDFDVTSDINLSNRIVAYSHVGVFAGTDIINLKFKNKALSDGEYATIVLGNAIASDGYNDIPGNIISKTITYQEPEYITGDLSKNGKIDLTDVILILKYYLGNLEITDEALSIGDIDQDGEISLKDVISLLRTYLLS